MSSEADFPEERKENQFIYGKKYPRKPNREAPLQSEPLLCLFYCSFDYPGSKHASKCLQSGVHGYEGDHL